MRPLIVTIAALAAFAAAPSAASAAVPGAATGAATDITATTATLNGVVNPNKEDTTFVFQYGTTTAYGSQTPAQPPVTGNAGKQVSVAISGLAPSTTYHFRLVATNPSGTDFGNDGVFTTAAPGPTPPPPANAVTIGASPSLITFGQSTVIAGQLTGPGNSGVRVELQENPYPFAGFRNIGAPTNTDASGRFSFTVSPGLLTHYQVVAKASPPVTSPAIQVRVRYAVSFSVNDTSVRRGQFVRFSGSVRPAHDGRPVRIQRRTRTGRYRTIATTRLRRSSVAGRSVYSRRLQVFRTGTYRIRVPADADHANGTSRTRRIRVP